MRLWVKHCSPISSTMHVLEALLCLLELPACSQKVEMASIIATLEFLHSQKRVSVMLVTTVSYMLPLGVHVDYMI